MGFDFYSYLEISFKHSWTTYGFSSIRRLTCRPASTSDTLCNVPCKSVIIYWVISSYIPFDFLILNLYTILKDPFPFQFPFPKYQNINEWCVGTFGNSSQYASFNITHNPGICNSIYTNAITEATTQAQTSILVISIICVVTSVIIIAAQYLCYYIITAPILSESMNDIINYLLVLPVACCFLMAWYLWDWQSYVNFPSFVSPLFFVLIIMITMTWHDRYTGLPYAWAPIAFASFGAALSFALPVGVVRHKLLCLDSFFFWWWWWWCIEVILIIVYNCYNYMNYIRSAVEWSRARCCPSTSLYCSSWRWDWPCSASSGLFTPRQCGWIFSSVKCPRMCTYSSSSFTTIIMIIILNMLFRLPVCLFFYLSSTLQLAACHKKLDGCCCCNGNVTVTITVIIILCLLCII